MLARALPNGRTHLRCSECGAQADAPAGVEQSHKLVCYCGASLMTGVDARLRCKKNKAITPEQPQEVVVVHLPDEEKPFKKPGKTAPRTVLAGGFDW